MADIEKLSVYDARIVQERPAFAVDKGALSLTNAPFTAIASTASQMTFNIQVPSLNVFIDREFEWSTGMNLSFTTTIAGTGTGDSTTPYVLFGRDVAFAPHPLHSIVSTMTATINDAVATINTADILYEVMRLTDYKVNRLQRTTPAMLDKYAQYKDSVGAVNNTLGSYFDGVDYDNIPNGSFWNVVFTDKDGAPLVGNNTSADGITGGYDDGIQQVGYLSGIPVFTQLAGGGAGALYTNPKIFVRIIATEKLILSPLIFSEEHGDEVGLYGVNNIQLVFNFQTPSRTIRNAPTAVGGTTRTISNVQFASGSPFLNPKMNIQFLTPSLDIALPPRNVLPYLEYARYLQQVPITATSGSLASGASQSGNQSTTITLPQIPDMLLIYLKPNLAGNPALADSYLPITRISVNFDNFAGLLSSHTTEQLYKMTVANGLKMDWNSWNGRGYVVSSAPATGNAYVQLVGGFLVLKMGKDITLQAGQAPSVVGNYTLQFNYEFFNSSFAPITAQPTLYIVAVNSGFFETQSGSSRIIKGILTEQDVISAPLAPIGSRASLERYVGGGFMSMLGTALNKAKDLLGRKEVRDVIKGVARSSGIGALRKGADVAEALGFGATGGVSTGGGRTGGRRRGAMLSALM